MAAGVCKLSLGECWVPTLALKIGCTLPASAIQYFDRKSFKLRKSAVYKSSIHGKRKRAASRVALKKKLQPNTVVEEFTSGYYLSSGKGLLKAMCDGTPK